MDDFKKKFNTNKKELNEDVISQIVNNAEVINKIYKENIANLEEKYIINAKDIKLWKLSSIIFLNLWRIEI